MGYRITWALVIHVLWQPYSSILIPTSAPPPSIHSFGVIFSVIMFAHAHSLGSLAAQLLEPLHISHAFMLSFWTLMPGHASRPVFVYTASSIPYACIIHIPLYSANHAFVAFCLPYVLCPPYGCPLSCLSILLTVLLLHLLIPSDSELPLVRFMIDYTCFKTNLIAQPTLAAL